MRQTLRCGLVLLPTALTCTGLGGLLDGAWAAENGDAVSLQETAVEGTEQ